MAKNLKELKECNIKINNIYKFIESKLDIFGVVFTTRSSHVHDKGFGKIEDNERPYNYRHIEYFENSQSYNHKKCFLDSIERTFDYFSDKNIKFYYLMDNPELGYYPGNCLKRPFGITLNNCKVDIKIYSDRTREYRNFVFDISKKYPHIKILDPKNLYCDDKFCYAIRNGKLLYYDDDHHSVDGSFEQAKYFLKDFSDLK